MVAKFFDGNKEIDRIIAENEIDTGVILVDEDVAKQLLNLNYNNQRNLRKAHIKRLAKEMKEGNWRRGQPLLFSDSGFLLDGQHRLYAVIESKSEVEFVYNKNLPEESMGVLDRGQRRTLEDLCHFDGLRQVTRVHTAATQCLLIPRYRSYGSSERVETLRDLLKLHIYAIDYAYQELGNKTPPPIISVVARAWYTSNRQRLHEFCYCIRNSVVIRGVEDNAAINLSARVAAVRDSDIAVRSSRVKIHDLTQNALQSFLNMEDKRNIVPQKKDPFPVLGLRKEDQGSPVVDRTELFSYIKERNATFSIKDIGTVD